MLLAVQQAGWQLVPINYHLVGPEIAYIIGDSGAKAFIADATFGGGGAFGGGGGLGFPGG